MAGTIVADFIRTDANQLSLNVGNTTFATINASGFFSNTGTQLIAANGKISGASLVSGSITSAALSTAANTIPRSSMTSGAVLQVVSNTISTSISTTSGAYVTTGLTASITPTSASSKILVLVNCASMFQNGAGAQLVIAIFRGATNLHAAAGAFGGQLYSTALIETPMSMMILDTPATTSSTTYTVHYAAVSGTATFNTNTGNSYIILQEIAG